MAGGAGVNESTVSEGSEVAVLVKANPGPAPSLMPVTSWGLALGLGSATRVSVCSRIRIVTQAE